MVLHIWWKSSSSPVIRKLIGWILGTASGTQGLPSYSNDETRMTFDLLWFGQICTTVAVSILEECCMAFANMQWVFLSGELIVAHGLLASWNFHGIVFTGSARNITQKCHGLKWRGFHRTMKKTQTFHRNFHGPLSQYWWMSAHL